MINLFKSFRPIFFSGKNCAILFFFLLPSITVLANEKPLDETAVNETNRTTAEPADRSRPQVFEGRTGPFEFIAPDSLSLQTSRDIARNVLRSAERIITLPEERIPRISVRLVPEGLGNLEEGETFRIFEDLIGDYGLAVSWRKDLPVSLFCDLLTEVYLKQVVFTEANRQAAERVPSWLIAAISLDVQTQMRPTLIKFLQFAGKNNEMIDLEQLFERRALSEMSFIERNSSYWFLQLMLRSMRNDQELRGFFDNVLDGQNPQELLQSMAGQSDRQSGEIEAWWVIGFQDLIHSQTGFVESIERSRRRFNSLSRFEWIMDGQPMVATVNGLWEFRNVPVVAEEIDFRLRLVESWLPRVNPVYFNSYQNLGLIFISIVEGDEDAFTLNVERMLGEWESSLIIDEDVRLLLEDPDQDLPEAEETTIQELLPF